MKSRLFALLCALPVLVLSADPAATAPVTATTLKKSNVTVGSAILPLTPGTKLEVLGREGDALVVKFRSTKGKVPLADTDYDPATVLPEPAAPEKPATKASSAAAATPAAKPAPSAPPALNTSATGAQPSSNYGKSVQKAKQATESSKSNRVDPTKDIMDEKQKE